MPKKLDWDKIKKMAENGFSVKEISDNIGVAKGTLYNNKNKWSIVNNKTQESIVEVISKDESKTPLNNVSSNKEVLEVKEFYKKALIKIRDKISDLLFRELDEDSYYEVQLLEKLVKITKEARHLDYIVNDILTYKDLASLEIMVKKLEIEATKISN